jgi:putative transposase
MVGARRYERLGSRRDQLNGTYLRRLLTSMGEVVRAEPRMRHGGAPAGVVGRYKRRTADVDRLVTTAYVQGVSPCGMTRLSQALMGEGISRSTVSRVTKVLGKRWSSCGAPRSKGRFHTFT